MTASKKRDVNNEDKSDSQEPPPEGAGCLDEMPVLTESFHTGAQEIIAHVWTQPHEQARAVRSRDEGSDRNRS
jgi:hypothetical protein